MIESPTLQRFSRGWKERLPPAARKRNCRSSRPNPLVIDESDCFTATSFEKRRLVVPVLLENSAWMSMQLLGAAYLRALTVISVIAIRSNSWLLTFELGGKFEY